MAARRDKMILPALHALKLCAVAQMVAAERPVCSAFLYFSDHYPPAIGCDCTCDHGGQGTLWVRLVQGSGVATDRALPLDCAGGRFEFTVEVGVWRCAPVSENATAPVDPGATWPDGMMHDLAALRRAVLCCDWLAERDVVPFITTMQPVGPSGGCVAAVVRAELHGTERGVG